jgi:hypothetical protein
MIADAFAQQPPEEGEERDVEAALDAAKGIDGSPGDMDLDMIQMILARESLDSRSRIGSWKLWECVRNTS